MAHAAVSSVIGIAVSMRESLRDLPGIEREIPAHEEIEEEYDARVFDKDLRAVTRSLFVGGHYRLSVLEAYKFVNNLVKDRVGSIGDGSGLMKNALSPAAPVLALNEMKTDSEKNEQLGYMEIMSGVMTGVRNPRAHEVSWPDDPKNAIELLTFAEHLVCKIRAAKKRRRRKKP